MKKYLILIAFLLNHILGSSQKPPQDLKEILLTDSVKVAFWQIVESNKAFIQLEECNQILILQDEMIHAKGLEAAFYKIGLDHCLKANDTMNLVILPRYEGMLRNREAVAKKANIELGKSKFKAGALTISLPILGVISLGIGVWLGSLIK